jgi:hypothetical protein
MHFCLCSSVCIPGTHLAQIFLYQELNYDSLIDDRSWNIWENFMKLINSESPVFTDVSFNPVFQILGDDRQASRSRFIVHICPSPINQTTQFMHIPLMTPSPYTLTSWQWISTERMFFVFKNWITECTSQSVGLVVDVVLYKALWHSNKFTEWLGKHWGCGRWSDNSSRPSKTSCKWPSRAGCANGSYFKNDPHNSSCLQ